MSHDLQLVTSRQFNGITLNCYRDGQDDPQDFWATREDIGAALGYGNPYRAISDIHRLNKQRLDKFSTVRDFRKVEGSRTVTRNVIVYNFKGLLEICRYSNQPNAHKVIDVLWDIADEIRRTGSYSVNIPALVKSLQNENALLREKVDSLLKQIQEERSFTVLGKVVSMQHGLISFSEAAKLLAQNGVKVGHYRLMERGREKKLLCNCKGRRKNQPTQKAIEQGLAVLGLTFGYKGVTFLTAKGLQYLANDFVGEIFPILALIEDGEVVNA